MSTLTSMRISRIMGTLLALLVLLASGGCNLDGGTPVGKHWFVAPTGSDSNDCKAVTTPCKTITAAIAKAVDGDSVFIAAGTYHEQVVISKSIAITGSSPNPEEVILDGEQKYQVLAVGCMACDKSVQVSNLVIQNGRAPDSGGFTGSGGVSVLGAKLTMSHVTIKDNEAGTFGLGMAAGIYIYSGATLKLSDAVISGNNNTNNGNQGDAYKSKGGGINNAGTLIITGNVTITNNEAIFQGGGIYNAPGAVADLTGATIENNHATSGGGIFSAGELIMNGGRFIGNTSNSGGGLYSTGVTSLSGVIFDGNQAITGGGISQVYSQLTTRLEATNITVKNNSADLGGGIANEFTMDTSLVAALGYLEITQSTIDSNHAHSGGGVFNFNRASMYLVNVTISNNTAIAGGGIASGQGGGGGIVLNTTIAYNSAGSGQGGGVATGGGSLKLQNVLLAQNANGNCSTVYGGILDSYAGNLSDDDSCNFHAPLDQNNVDAKIGLLTYNGGPTQTIALKPGSPAIDAALGWLAPLIDQRGAGRDVDGNGDGTPGFDVGAYEHTSVVMSQQTTPIQVVTITPMPYTFEIMEPVDCRLGPGLEYPSQFSLVAGAAPAVLARSEDSLWYDLFQPGEYLCWAPASSGKLNGDPGGLPVRKRPTLVPSYTPTLVPSYTPTLVPSYTPTNVPVLLPSFTPTLVLACSSYTERGACENHGCTWTPYPSGAPGGTCGP